MVWRICVLALCATLLAFCGRLHAQSMESTFEPVSEQPNCPTGQEFVLCPPPCPRTCDHENGTKCEPTPEDKLSCVAGCHCPAGKVLASRDRCVRPRRCAQISAKDALRQRKKKANQAKKRQQSKKTKPAKGKKTKKTVTCSQIRSRHTRECMARNNTRKDCRRHAATCSKDGSFTARQCRDSNCSCAHKDGRKILDTEHQRSDRSVDCPGKRAGVTCLGKKRYRLCQPACMLCPVGNGSVECVNVTNRSDCNPGCYCPTRTLLDTDGVCVRRRQCGKAETRQATTGQTNQAVELTPCQQRRNAALNVCKSDRNATKSDMSTCRKAVVKCNKEGSFAARQCVDGQCVCVRETGVVIIGTEHAATPKRNAADCLAARAGVTCPTGQRFQLCQPKACPRTCAHVRGDESCSPGDDTTPCTPGCQCGEGRVFDADLQRCVLPTQEKCKALSPCQRRQLLERKACATLSAAPISASGKRKRSKSKRRGRKNNPRGNNNRGACNVIMCKEDGSFAPRQCYRLAQLCHCVDEDGHLILGSTHPLRRGRRRLFRVDCEQARQHQQP